MMRNYINMQFIVDANVKNLLESKNVYNKIN